MKTSEHEKQAVIFFTLLAGIAVAIILLLTFNLLTPFAILLVVLGAMIVVYTQMGNYFAQIHEYERAIVFSAGRFKTVFGPGWLFLIPFFESFERVDLRTKTYDVPPQDVVTKDNIKLKIDAIIYAGVSDAKSVVLNVKDYETSMKTFVSATLRDVIGKLDLSEVISQVNTLNQILQKALEEVTTQWGIKVVKVEIQSLELPKSLQDAMHETASAEQHKKAASERAQAKKLTIDAIQEAGGKLTDPTLQYLYLESLQKIAEGKSTKIIFPMELTKIAEQLSKKIGNFSMAENIVQKEYNEKVAEKKSTKSALSELAAQYGIKLEEKNARKKR